MIRAEKANFSVAFMCRQLKVSTSGYYAWKQRPVSRRQQANERLLPMIRDAHRASRGTYGSPRIYDDIKDLGETAGRHKIAKLMRENGITARPLKKFRKTTDSKHKLPIAANLLERNFTADAPDRVWVSDVTYVWTLCGWVYLAVIVDLFSRRVVGWALENHMRTELILKTLENAQGHRNIAPGLIFHSDRGVQYASNEFRDKLSEHGISQSMSRKGDCWDNAVAESFFATIKRELIYKALWINQKNVRAGIHEYIEAFYNRKRKHSTNGNLSPVDYERCFQNQAAVAA